MTERKPSGQSWESHIDKQIRRAQAEGAFDDLPGLGKPIPDLHKPYDELWWVRGLLKREDLEFLPDSLALKRDAEKMLERIGRQRSEREVRRLVAELNTRIVKANRTATSGPSCDLSPLDADDVVRRWRKNRRPPSS